MRYESELACLIVNYCLLNQEEVVVSERRQEDGDDCMLFLNHTGGVWYFRDLLWQISETEENNGS